MNNKKITFFSKRIESLSTLRINIIANYAGKYWSALLSFLAIPIYLHYLGVEAYGLIGAFAAIASFVGILDLGLSQTVSREVSIRNADPEKQKTLPDLLRTIEIIYWLIGLFILFIMILASKVIATQWLNINTLDSETVEFSVLLLGMTIAFQWPGTPYFGTLIALERQVELNFLQSGISTLQTIGAAAILIWVSPTITAFALWQGAVTILKIQCYRLLAWRVIPGDISKPSFNLNILREVWKFAGGMSAVMLVSLLLVNLDKVLLSRLLPLKEFGYYMVASTLSVQLIQIFTPFLYAISPRINAIYGQKNENELARVFHQGCLFISAIVTPLASTIIIFSKEILEIWTRSPLIAENAASPLSLLVFGGLMNSMMQIPFQLQLAIGKPQIALKVNVCAVIFLIPAMLIIVPRFGMIGGAIIWATLNTIYYIGTSRITHWYILKKEYKNWLIKDTFIPIMISMSIVFFAWEIQNFYELKFVTITSLIMGVAISYGSEFLYYKYQNNLYKFQY